VQYDNAKSVSKWTGGGIHAETNPKSNEATDCTTMLEASPTGFSVPSDFKPSDGFFDCKPEYVAHLTGNYGKGTTLQDAGKTLADLK